MKLSNPRSQQQKRKKSSVSPRTMARSVSALARSASSLKPLNRTVSDGSGQSYVSKSKVVGSMVRRGFFQTSKYRLLFGFSQ